MGQQKIIASYYECFSIALFPCQPAKKKLAMFLDKLFGVKSEWQKKLDVCE